MQTAIHKQKCLKVSKCLRACASSDGFVQGLQSKQLILGVCISYQELQEKKNYLVCQYSLTETLWLLNANNTMKRKLHNKRNSITIKSVYCSAQKEVSANCLSLEWSWHCCYNMCKATMQHIQHFLSPLGSTRILNHRVLWLVIW